MADSKPAVYSAPVAPGFVASTAQAIRPNAKLIALLSLGHFVVDLNQGSLPAFLPFLKTAHQLSYSAVATIVLAANVASSIVQPLFGYFADRTARRWMLPASVLLTGGGFALMGLAPGYVALLGLVVAMGLGVAAYHPEAYKTATGVAGEKKATALSWFSLGGNVGVALGPPVITALVTVVGLTGSLGLLAPTLIASALLLAALPFGVLFLLVRGPLAFVMLGIFGALLTSSFTVSVVLGQAYLPRNAGTASGLIVGFAIGAGGLGVTALGWVADRYGLPVALWISALTPLLAFAATRFLPAPRVHEAR